MTEPLLPGVPRPPLQVIGSSAGAVGQGMKKVGGFGPTREVLQCEGKVSNVNTEKRTMAK
jgi:hypothetical protein